MIPYENSAGNSGVIAYKMGTDYIEVQFVDGHTYTYTNKSAGAGHIAQMKKLAKAGQGLSTFISRFVKDGYERKL